MYFRFFLFLKTNEWLHDYCSSKHLEKKLIPSQKLKILLVQSLSVPEGVKDKFKNKSCNSKYKLCFPHKNPIHSGKSLLFIYRYLKTNLVLDPRPVTYILFLDVKPILEHCLDIVVFKVFPNVWNRNIHDAYDNLQNEYKSL